MTLVVESPGADQPDAFESAAFPSCGSGCNDFGEGAVVRADMAVGADRGIAVVAVVLMTVGAETAAPGRTRAGNATLVVGGPIRTGEVLITGGELSFAAGASCV